MNPICDLNGDKVDDIIIVDKSGRPVIINGYKLVRADPYKKLWNTERINAIKRGKEIKPFEEWMRDLMEVKRTWNYDEQTWKEGKVEFDPEQISGKGKTVYNMYAKSGVGKPRIGTRITARGLWSSIFAKLWKVALTTMFTDKKNQHGSTIYYSRLEPLKTLFNYFKVSTAIFIVKYEVKVMEAHECGNNWVKWLSYKSAHSKEINAELGRAKFATRIIIVIQ